MPTPPPCPFGAIASFGADFRISGQPSVSEQTFGAGVGYWGKVPRGMALGSPWRITVGTADIVRKPGDRRPDPARNAVQIQAQHTRKKRRTTRPDHPWRRQCHIRPHRLRQRLEGIPRQAARRIHLKNLKTRIGGFKYRDSGALKPFNP